MNQLFITGQMSFKPHDLSGKACIMQYNTEATITMKMSKNGVNMIIKDYHYEITSLDPEDIFQEIERKRFTSYTTLFDSGIGWDPTDTIHLQFDPDNQFIRALVAYMKDKNKSLLELG